MPFLILLVLAGITSCVTGASNVSKGIMAHYATSSTGWHRADGGNYTNPITASPASLAKGKKIYQQNCGACHGPKGLGDGPAAASNNPKPANLVEVIPKKTDSYLYLQVSQGRLGMPIWKESIEEEDRWHIVNYLRSLPNQAKSP